MRADNEPNWVVLDFKDAGLSEFESELFKALLNDRSVLSNAEKPNIRAYQSETNEVNFEMRAPLRNSDIVMMPIDFNNDNVEKFIFSYPTFLGG